MQIFEMVKPYKMKNWKFYNFKLSGWGGGGGYSVSIASINKHFFYPRESIRKQISQITTRNI